MSDENSQLEQDLREFGERVRSGFARRHPVTPKQRSAVHDAVRQLWEMEKGKTPPPGGKAHSQQVEPEQDQAPAKTISPAPPPPPQPKDRDWGHSH